MCSKLSISRQVLRLFEALQELLLAFSYLSVLRFSRWFATSISFMAYGNALSYQIVSLTLTEISQDF